MLEQLIDWDKSLFIFLNSFNSEFFNAFFWLFTKKETWIPLYITLFYVIIKSKRKESLWIIAGLIITIALADQISSSLIKPLVARLRPSQEPSLNGIIHLIDGYKGGKYGFVSSHAANSFALALYSSQLFKNKVFTISIFTWAFINSYSRIYMGVHFPFDIICGALIGILSAWLVYSLLKKYSSLSSDSFNIPKHFWSSEKLVLLVLSISFLFVFIYAFLKILWVSF